MKNYLIIITISILFICLDCNHKVDSKTYIDKIESIIGFRVPNRFETIDKNQTQAFGDYIDIFELKFNRSDFDSIFKILVIKSEKVNDSIFQINKIISNNERINLLIFPKKQTIKYSHAEL
jgi:hypothetical protein